MKPEWMKRQEAKPVVRFKMCINCRHVGEHYGYTNNLGKGRGRAKIYRCKLHPTVTLYCESYACTDYEYGPTGVE